jgi:hypothetical protein
MRWPIVAGVCAAFVALAFVLLPAQETCQTRWASIKTQLADIQSKTSTLRAPNRTVTDSKYNALVASENALKALQDAFEAAACIVVSPPPPPPPQPACSDGIDNDGDGLTDLADPGCANASDTDETDPSPPPPPPPGGSCGLQLNTDTLAFCEEFSTAYPNTNRSGQLNGELWGVSRLAGLTTRWNTSTLDSCAGPQAASPDATDVIVCNGRLRESQNDNHNVTMLAMYPKQPFDFAGRTGTVAFDVTNDTSGVHGAWPEFWITDKPTPAPFIHGGPPGCDFCSVPRNGFGIRFDAEHGDCGGPAWRAGSAVVVRDYVPEERGIFDGNATGMQIRQTGQCASLSSGPNGGLNHIELRMSQDSIDVYASDAGSSTLKLINTIRQANLPITRGLIWIGDAHYAAAKSPIPSHQIHTFTWDNVAFDGPATYRDLSFDVLDRLGPGNGIDDLNLGWDTPVTLQTLPMTAQNISAATGALLMFNFWTFNPITSFTYTINGHTTTAASPVPASLSGSRSVSLAVPLAFLVAGPQTVVLSANNPMSVSNVNIVLVAAASVP